jgi:hypothetical protein
MNDAPSHAAPFGLEEVECSLSRKDDIPIAVPVLHRVESRLDTRPTWPNRTAWHWLYGGIAVLAICVAFYHRPNVQASVSHATPIQMIVPLFIEEKRAHAELCPLCACSSSQSRVCTSIVTMSRQAWLNFDGMCHICSQVENKAHAIPVDEQLERGLAVMSTDSLYKVGDPVATLIASSLSPYTPIQKCRNAVQISTDDFFLLHSNYVWKYAVGTSLRNSIVDTLTRIQAYYSCYVDDNTKSIIHDRIAFWFFAFNHTHGIYEKKHRRFVTEVNMTMHAPLKTYD